MQARDATVWPRDPGEAIDRLVTDYGRWVLRLVSLHIERAVGEDVMQEAFLRAYRGWSRFYAEGGATQEARVRAWLARIAVNLCRDRWRRQRSRGTLLPWESSDDGPLAPSVAVASDPAGDPELALLAAERRAALRQALRRLPLPDQRVLMLYYYFDLDTPAIARLDGCPEATVRSRLMRARPRLRRALETTDEEDERNGNG